MELVHKGLDIPCRMYHNAKQIVIAKLSSLDARVLIPITIVSSLISMSLYKVFLMNSNHNIINNSNKMKTNDLQKYYLILTSTAKYIYLTN